MNLLEVRDLEVSYAGRHQRLRAVDGISFDLAPGQTLGIVGESGSGKSQTALAIAGLLTPDARCRGSVRLQGRELLGLPRRAWDAIRGAQIGFVFQDPMTSLNPYRRIGAQLAEVLTQHRGASQTAALAAAARMLDAVGIADARTRLRQYPHEFSGGMRQRVTIAMALLAEPKLLIADEPTTALDVTVQAQLLALLASLGSALNLALILISHDLGVIAESCERGLVLYAGRIVEAASTAHLLQRPQHPYTQALLASRPRLDRPRPARLSAISGQPPNPAEPSDGCAFTPRCEQRLPCCTHSVPALAGSGEHRCACYAVNGCQAVDDTASRGDPVPDTGAPRP